MISVGVRELRDNLSKLLQRVRDEGEVIEITVRGEPIARIIPMKRQTSTLEELAKQWADLDQLIAEISARTKDKVNVDAVDLDQLAAEIAANWTGEIDAVEAVREQRRDL